MEPVPSLMALVIWMEPVPSLMGSSHMEPVPSQYGLASCSSAEPVPAPVGGGLGSSHGNNLVEVPGSKSRLMAHGMDKSQGPPSQFDLSL